MKCEINKMFTLKKELMSLEKGFLCTNLKRPYFQYLLFL